ncbi:hypothetical protein N665_8956s0001 [Sinapis alba]|nr:hypothetical protein N665_8956s0001 [Sinapis alba]
MLCTEYLGFESTYDMKMSQNEVEKRMTCHAEEETERVEIKRRKTTEEQNVVAPVKEGKRDFPPLLSSLNGRGHRSFYLQPIFHASRENGRLRLHLVNGTTKKGCNGTLREEITVDNTIKAWCDHKGPTRVRLEHGREPNEDNNGDAVVDFSMINDETGAGSLTYKSNYKEGLLNSNNVTEHDAREWNCYTSGNHDKNDYHHHHIRPYHHYGSNDNMYLWSPSYVKTR